MLVAPLRAERPGAQRAVAEPNDPGARAGCPFCEGRESETPPETFAVASPGRAADTPGWRLRVVPNKFPALSPGGGEARQGIFAAEPARGRQEVVIHTPRHVLTVAELDAREIERVAETWQARARAAADAGYRYLHASINEGEAAGATLAHTHSQLYWLSFDPPSFAAERAATPQARINLIGDLIRAERESRTRVVVEQDGLVALCPYASRYPYELLIAPVEPETDAFQSGLFESAVALLADGIRRLRAAVGQASVNAWVVSSPFGEPLTHWRLVVVPRLVVPAGLELGAELYINPVAPEVAAGVLREA